MKKQGQRTDLTSTPLGQKLGKYSVEVLGESRSQIQRFIRLTNLIPELLGLVDKSVLKEKDKLQIALRPRWSYRICQKRSSQIYMKR